MFSKKLMKRREKNMVLRLAAECKPEFGLQMFFFVNREAVYCAAATMVAKSWGFREAPPMRPPSTSG